jgi:hypothetical protein
MEPSRITTSHPVHHEKKASIASLGVFAFLAAMLVLCGLSSATAQAIPGAVIYQTKTLVNINGNAGHVAANNLGDAFYVSQTDNVAYWLPRGTTTPVSLVTGLSGGRSVSVDAFNNVYVSSNYSGRVIEVPYVNGSYATGTANSSSLPACTAAPTTPCLAFGNGAGATGYYLQASDIGFDQATNSTKGPNAYIIDERDNNCDQSTAAKTCNTILKFTPSSNGAYTATVVVTGLPQTNNGQIAVGPNGDIYYADGSHLYYIAAGTTSAVTIGTGLTNPTGVTTDSYGNLYITNASAPNAIFEMPAVNGVAQPNQQFTFLGTYSANGIGIDGLGHVYYTAYSGQTNLNVATINTFSLGSAAIGTPVSASATTLTVQFNANVNLAVITPAGAAAGFSYVTGTCAPGAYSAGNTCNFNVNYTPTAAGLQKGAVSLTTSTGANIAVASLSGIGMGAVQTSDPGSISAIGSGFSNPQGIAVDSAQNVYIADAGANIVLVYPVGSSTGTPVGTGLVGPTSVALDSAGNLYIADSGNGRVVGVPNINGTLTSSAQTVVINSYNIIDSKGVITSQNLGTDIGIGIDLNNNMYVADSANKQVLRLGTVAGVPSSSATSLVGLDSGGNPIFTAPIAVATDSTGNLFIADTTANTVTEITYYGKQTLPIGTGYSHPSGLATDASGSLYVADSGNGRLLKIPFESPIFNTNDQYAVGAAIVAPYGVALDGSANLYVVDSANPNAYVLNRAQGTLPLGRANISTSTSQLNGYIGNAGNQPLILGNPGYVATGDTGVFTITSPANTGCVNSASVAPGFACVLSATFAPTVVGNYSELLSFTSNATNTTTPSLTLTGTGLNQAVTTTALAQTSPSGTAAFGQAITITATIASSKSGTPSGSVAFSVDGGQAKNVTITGNTAKITLAALTGGNHTISASYSGDLLFAPSNAILTIAVAQASSTTAIAATKNANLNPSSALPGALVTLTATITPGASTVPTGQVTFTLNGKALAPPASVVQTTTTAYSVTTITYTASISTATLPLGTNSIVATYSGDVNYASSSGTLPVTISPMTFTLSPATASVTMTTGQTATASLQVVSLSGYNGFVGLSCTGLPANLTCGFSPNNFILQADNLITKQQTSPDGSVITVPATYGPMNVTLSVIPATTPVVPQPPVGALNIPLFGKKVPISAAFLLLSPLVFAVRRRSALKHLRGSLSLLSALLVLFGSITMFSGCGSNQPGVTPSGTYTVTVRAVSTAVAPSGSSVASSYSGAYAPGCSNSPAGSADSTGALIVTCEQDAQLSLTVKQ